MDDLKAFMTSHGPQTSLGHWLHTDDLPIESAAPTLEQQTAKGGPEAHAPDTNVTHWLHAYTTRI